MINKFSSFTVYNTLKSGHVILQ